MIRTHQLRVKGALGHDSAVTLETEIDALLELEIEELVLDLGELRAIDATGVQVIAMRCGLCRRRGVKVELTGAVGSVAEALAAVGLDAAGRWLDEPQHSGLDAEPAQIVEAS